jgi:hypothetical protein
MRSTNLTKQQRNAITLITADHVMRQTKTKKQVISELQEKACITSALANAIYLKLFG